MQWVSSSNRKVLLGFGSVMYFVVRRERSAAVQQVSPPVQEHSETAASTVVDKVHIAFNRLGRFSKASVEQGNRRGNSSGTRICPWWRF